MNSWISNASCEANAQADTVKLDPERSYRLIFSNARWEAVSPVDKMVVGKKNPQRQAPVEQQTMGQFNSQLGNR